MNEKIYLYMGRRDKKEIKVLTIFKGAQLPRTRVDNVKKLHLPTKTEIALYRTIYKNRFLWEVWIESAENYTKLTKSLEKRGYRNIPMSSNPIHPLEIQSVVSNPITNITPDTRELPIKRKTMIQRKSRRN